MLDVKLVYNKVVYKFMYLAGVKVWLHLAL